MAYVDDLKSARDSLATELKNETARRAALTAAGHPPPATYTVGGRSVDWSGYLAAITAQIKEIDALVAANGGDGGYPEVVVRGYC